MEWGKLQTFIVVARTGTLARAGRALGVDPTTVSRTLRALERELGRTLFERARGGQVLTSAGRGLMASAEAMERAAREFEESYAGASGDAGLLRVSVSEGFGTGFIAPRIGSFVAQHPRILLDLVASSGFLSPSRKEADIAILLARPRKGPLKTRKLTEYALGVYQRADGCFGDKRPLVSYIPDLIYAPELDYVGETGLARAPSIRSSSINAQHQMVAAGTGFGILPCFIADADPRLLRIRPEVTIKRTFWLAVHQDASLLPRVRSFIDWLARVCIENQALLRGEQTGSAAS